MTAPVRIRLAELTRATKALERAGVRITGAKVNPDGSVELLTGSPEAANDRPNPFDKKLGL